DADLAGRYLDAGLAAAVIDDADRLADRQAKALVVGVGVWVGVVAGVEHGDLPVGDGLVVRPLEGAAWRAETAIVGVAAARRRQVGAREGRQAGGADRPGGGHGKSERQQGGCEQEWRGPGHGTLLVRADRAAVAALFPADGGRCRVAVAVAVDV